MYGRFGFQQSSVARHEIQQDSYAVEAWQSKNQFNRSSGMGIMPGSCIDTQLMTHHNKLGGRHNMQQNGWHGQDMHQSSWQAAGHHGAVSAGGRRLPFSDCNASNFSNNSMMRNGMEENAWSMASARYNQGSGGKMTSAHYNQGFPGKRMAFNGCNASNFSNGAMLMSDMEETAEYETFQGAYLPTATGMQEISYQHNGYWMAKGL